ncbi:MAG: signal recognition particle protein [Hyphomicrobium zavarzinii]|jgi:signal recognition particle subunit SRP54|uniref:signal recognition particle protein n=1 Tax=Hyphomicrobium zavarzinii TaxID=48292 RepID=UPI001A3FC4F8|nr:signal recognition particle protein [Hyphomicrobium zavarzinii]MBL8846466.1 signal recognition particle protein [Hyphomicrobium zavarzinii]HML42466.1 signal recognition particle protein [Hyphomicrobium zavarzinii]
MFQSLSDRLGQVFEKLTKRGALTENDVSEAMREVRRSLIEADVALDVVRDFIDRVKAKAIGQEVLRSVTPGQMVVKIVNDELVRTLGSDAQPIDLHAAPPVAILMAGLQGSGKTTTTAKIAWRLKNRDKKKVLMASLDTRRPAAQEQLRVLGEQTEVPTLPIIAGQTPIQIAKRAMEAARLGGYDVVLLDTAGRTTLDEELMVEVAEVKAATQPHEILLVLDSLTGQDAVNTAKAFDSRLGITGTVLTRADGDGRGGAALSMRAVTGKPIKLLGTGEKWDALEDFDPQRVAGRILGMGDIVGLVEKAAQTIDVEKAKSIAQKMKKGEFDLEDLAEQLAQMEKIGGMGGVLGMLPGIGKMKAQINEAGLEKDLKRQRAIISSMTPKERRQPKVLDAKRKRRIAAGSGTRVEDINKLLKQHRQMADMMKAMGKNRGMMSRMFGMGGGGGPSEAEIAQMQGELAKLDPKALEQLPADLKDALPKGLPGLGGGGVPRLPGLGGGLPGLGGQLPKFPGFPGKKK